LEFNNILGREFAPRQIGANCAPTHDRLVKLPFRTFITTIYWGQYCELQRVAR
jgi:hypothetical protein